MSDNANPSAPSREASRANAAGRVGSAVCATVLGSGHLITAYLVVLAYAAEPAGPWDSETVSHSGFAAGAALGLAIVTWMLTLLCVKAGWLRRWWLVVPSVLALAALLRLTLLAPEL